MRIKIALVLVFVALILTSTGISAQGLKKSPQPTPKVNGLSQASLKSCQAREDAVKNRMNSLMKMAANMEKVFDSIALRVENYYTQNILNSDKKVSNYDSLVADITAKKGIVDADLVNLKGVVDSFNCTSGDPKGLITQFRTGMQKVKSDLKVYRTSVKNLIVAVRRVAPSPEPSEKPETK